MSKHDCPDCRCEEAPVCVGNHCLHYGMTWRGEGSFCCRCPYFESVQRDTTTADSFWPSPGCKLKLEVY